MFSTRTVQITVATVLLLTASISFATPFEGLTGKNVKLTNGAAGTTDGGEFNIDVLGNVKGTDYISFCLEMHESIYYDTTYTISSISDYAESKKNYGYGATNIAYSRIATDEVSDLTKWLAYTYSFGDFSDKNGTSYEGLEDNLANYVQLLIWINEQELTWNNIKHSKSLKKYYKELNDFYTTYIKRFDNDSDDNKTYLETYDDYVKVMNLVDKCGNQVQS